LSAAKLRPHINAKIIEASAEHVVTGCFMTFFPFTPYQPRIIFFLAAPTLTNITADCKTKKTAIHRNGYCFITSPKLMTHDSRLRASRLDTIVTSK
jgi:hypothetical protein